MVIFVIFGTFVSRSLENVQEIAEFSRIFRKISDFLVNF